MYLMNRSLKWLVPFGPVIESTTTEQAFLTEHPWVLFESGRFNKVPLISGFTQDEGILLFAAGVMSKNDILARMNQHWNAVAPTLFYYDTWNITSAEKDTISNKIRKFYFGDKPIGGTTRQNLTNLYSDRLFVQGIFDTVELHSNFAPVYPYVMSFKGGKSSVGSHYQIPVSTHGDDSQYLFNFQEFPFGTEQFKFSSNLISLWTSFAATGKPVGDTPTLDSWEIATVGKANGKWFDLNFETKTLSNYLEERRQFWKDLGVKKFEAY
ncbi:unnamed protein product [Allacma fusca]|uniref:Carboxylesterase type B domain-containing protein n=1 Tax=Allacma fusca TaxID=39272 RepID=A0A8J2LBB4_9HEXA|nr:unnamed protein product [Allacma fusca]